MTGSRRVRVGYLHHSTGEIVWAGGMHRRLYGAWSGLPDGVKRFGDRLWSGGVADFLRRWNAEHATDYRITAVTYPATTGGYPWANYPYDYWNLWVRHGGANRDRAEQTLEDLALAYDVIVFKHCFSVSRLKDVPGPASASSDVKTLGNFKLQYEALKARLHEFPRTRFILWTGPVLDRRSTDPEQARRAREFFDWVRETWDEKGDNIHLWDFYALSADETGVLAPGYSKAPGDSHPSALLARKAAPLLGRRIVDVIEGRGDVSSATGGPAVALRARAAP